MRIREARRAASCRRGSSRRWPRWAWGVVVAGDGLASRQQALPAGVQAVHRAPLDAVAVRDVRIWSPEGGSIDFTGPWNYLANFCTRHEVVQICFDPYQLHSWAQNFRLEHGVWMSEFAQGPLRSQADVSLLQLVRAGRLKHDGDPALRQHMLNAALKIGVGEDSKGRLVKSAPSKKIDAAVALSMAAHQVLRLVL